MDPVDLAAIEDAIRILLYRMPPGATLDAGRGEADKHATVRLTVDGQTTTYQAEQRK